jgi:hypothetical protein
LLKSEKRLAKFGLYFRAAQDKMRATSKTTGEEIKQMAGPIKHIVMWRLRGETPAERTAARTKVKTLFEGLKGRIDGLTHIEVGADVSNVDYACDVVLVSECRLCRLDRRRIDHRASARRSPCAPTCRNRAADQLCRLGDDADPRRDQDGIKTTQSTRRAAGDRDLRRRPHHDDAAEAIGDIRHQRDRACGRGALRAGSQSRHIADGGGRHPGAGRRCRKSAPSRTIARRAAMRSMAPGSAAVCLGAVGMALHHKLCHTLGGTFNLPHAETHTIVLPHALAYNAPAAPEAMDADRARDRRERCGARSLRSGAKACCAGKSLREIGMPESGIDQAPTSP